MLRESREFTALSRVPEISVRLAKMSCNLDTVTGVGKGKISEVFGSAR